MTENTEPTDGETAGKEVYYLLPMFVVACALLFLGRRVILYHGAWFSGGMGGLIVMLGGGTAEQSREVFDAVQMAEPMLWEQIAAYLGTGLMFLQTVIIYTGWFIHD